MEDRLVHARRIARAVETCRVTLLMNKIQQDIWEGSARAGMLMGAGATAFDLDEDDQRELIARFKQLGFDCSLSKDNFSAHNCHIIVVQPKSNLTDPEPSNEVYEASLANAHVKGETINDG